MHIQPQLVAEAVWKGQCVGAGLNDVGRRAVEEPQRLHAFGEFQRGLLVHLHKGHPCTTLLYAMHLRAEQHVIQLALMRQKTPAHRQRAGYIAGVAQGAAGGGIVDHQVTVGQAVVVLEQVQDVATAGEDRAVGLLHALAAQHMAHMRHHFTLDHAGAGGAHGQAMHLFGHPQGAFDLRQFLLVLDFAQGHHCADQGT